MANIKNIILIDDDPLVHGTFELFVMNAGCKLTSIMDVQKASEYADNPNMFEKPDLLFIDLMLGSILGTDLIKKMREHAYFDKIPIILYTGYDCPSKDVDSLKIAGVLKKPSSKEDVLRCIEGAYKH